MSINNIHEIYQNNTIYTRRHDPKPPADGRKTH